MPTMNIAAAITAIAGSIGPAYFVHLGSRSDRVGMTGAPRVQRWFGGDTTTEP
jgi:hypothetical protein